MITVVGSTNMDLITSVVELPRPGETVLGSSLMRAAGGKGANQAVAAARAGGEVVFVGRIGDDESGSILLQALQATGVGTNHIVIDKDHPTGLALITVNDRGENTIVVVSGANGEVSSADVERASAALRASSYLVMQLEIPLETVAYAADLAAGLAVKLILNAAPARQLPTSLLEQVDVLVANQHEIATLSGMGAPHDPAAAARMLLSSGAKAVVLTLGGDGAVIVLPGTPDVEIPAFPADVRDTTGAGDTFVGNLAQGLDTGQSLAEAARLAAAAAALSVERSGAQPSMPTRVETEALLQGNSK